jgi:L,D-peptidoglycan transpeptidase YkuD (ErfK/YbiS/YcfS/YnhG family)
MPDGKLVTTRPNRPPSARLLTRVTVVASVRDRRRGVLIAGGASFPCALGRSGIGTVKREGDGRTPRAALPLRRVFFRADRVARPRTALPLRIITPRDAWCDDLADRRYNRLIARPPGAAEERLWRDDRLYDVVVELGWNDAPVIRGRGSAIFWHLARPGLTPTAGCVAVAGAVFRKLLPRLAANCVMRIR